MTMVKPTTEPVEIKVPDGLTMDEEEKFILEWEKANLEAVQNDYEYRCEQRKAFTVLKRTGPVSQYFEERISLHDSIDLHIIQGIRENGICGKIDQLYKQMLQGDEHPDLTTVTNRHLCDNIIYLSDIVDSFGKEALPPETFSLGKKAKAIITGEIIIEKIRQSPLAEQGGFLGKIKKYTKKEDEFKPLTSFVIEPVESIHVPDQGEFVRIQLITKEKRCEVTIPPDAWLSAQKFLKSLPSKEFTFVGSNADTQLLRAHIASYDMPHKKGVTVAGFHNGLFVTDQGALSAKGITQDLVYMNDQKSYCNLITATPCQTKDDFSFLKEFNAPGVTLSVLGWTVACFFKPRILKILGGFPVLNITGEAGAGKTSTLRSVIMRLWAFSGEPHSISQQTDFTLMKLVSGSNCIPLALEENKRSMQDEKSKIAISNLIRSCYNALEGQRGRADQTLINYRYEAPSVIVGESGFVESALLDRLVVVQMSKADSKPFKGIFDQVKKLPLESIGRSILDRALTISDEEVKKILTEEQSKVSEKLRDRPRDNAAVCRFGLRILSNTIGLKLTDDDYNKIDLTVLSGISEDGKDRKSVIDRIIEAMGSMSAFNPATKLTDDYKTAVEVRSYSFVDHLKPFVHYQTDGASLRLWVSGAYPVFLKWAKTYSFDGDVIDEGSFKRQLQKEPYFIKNAPSKIGGKTRRTVFLDIEKLNNKGLEIPDEWLNPHEL